MTAINFALQVPYDTAIYLPAVQPGYIDLFKRTTAPERPLPNGFDINDLAFWTGKSKIFNHKFCLFSVGSQQIGSDFISPLFDRTKGNYCIIGDSGGFQIGKGTLNGLKGLKKGITGDQAVSAWRYENNDARNWIISSLSTYFEYGMTIDMALWIMEKGGKDSPFHNCTEEQLITMTVENLRQIESEKFENTKWLNVLQGTTRENIINWWMAVKYFRHGGWALAGATGWRGGLYNVLFTILTIRDDDGFSKGQDWLHMLGVSQPVWDVLLTACQRELRKINPSLQFSYDSSTPFMVGGKLDQYAISPSLGTDMGSWVIRYETLDAVRKNAKSNELAFAENKSLLGKLIELQHLVINYDAFAGRRIDNISNQLMSNHNIWVILDACKRANEIAFGNRCELIPPQLFEVLKIIEESFRVEDWQIFLKNNKAVMDALAPSQYSED